MYNDKDVRLTASDDLFGFAEKSSLFNIKFFILDDGLVRLFLVAGHFKSLYKHQN